MTLQLAERLGVQEPTIRHGPPDVVSLDAAEEAIELANYYGVADGNLLSESQKITLRLAGGERADGSWAATRVADFGPRQGTGKNDKIAAWELAHLLLFGTQLIIHTAHEFPTANESFLRLVAVFDAWDELRSKVDRIRYANGEQGIELLSGQRLKYRARTGGSGRGFAKAGLLIYDEAQHLGREHVAASGPSKLANPNSQTWYAGSGGLVTSAKAWEVRRAALLGTGGRLAYTEMTGESVTVSNGKFLSVKPDPLDREVWYRCIPGLGRWVTEEGVEALYDELGPDIFMREILCVWDPEPDADGNSSISPVLWEQLADKTSVVASHDQWSIAVSPKRDWSAIGISGRNAEGYLHVERLDHRPGTGWVVDRAKEIWDAKRIPVRVRAGKTASSALIGPLREAGVEVVEVSAVDAAQACGQFIDAANTGRLVHLGQASLTKALRNAEERVSAEGGRAWWVNPRGATEISVLDAVTIALGGVPQEVAEPSIYVWKGGAKK